MERGLKVDQKIFSNETVLSLSGPIDDSFNLPNCQGATKVRLDLDGVNFVDSIGVRAWCRWAETHKKVPRIELERCPVILIKHFNIIRGFLAPNMSVTSFYVPYLSATTEDAVFMLFKLGVEYQADGELSYPSVKGSDGAPLEMDVIPASYFKFLKLFPPAP